MRRTLISQAAVNGTFITTYYLPYLLSIIGTAPDTYLPTHIAQPTQNNQS